jgi:hypothetical protein
MESRANPRENTARVAMRGSELPGWFWGLLGCLSVLGVGSAVLFFVFKPAGGLAGPANLAAPAAPADRPTSSAQIDIEPMAPPRAEAVAAPKPRPAPHAMKIAHAPAAAHSAGSPAAAAEPAAADDSDDDAPKAKAKTKEPADDSDDDQPAASRKVPAASDKSGDKSDKAEKSDKSDDKSDDNKEL